MKSGGPSTSPSSSVGDLWVRFERLVQVALGDSAADRHAEPAAARE